MISREVFVVVLLIALATAFPAGDVEIVESTIREVRAIAPQDLRAAGTKNFEEIHEGDDQDSVGYLKRSEDGGSDGYKHFDSYHKKDGDKYGYEKHTSYGDANKGAHESDDEGKETKNSYKVAEESDGDDGGYEHGIGGHYTEGDTGEYNEGGEYYAEGDDGDDGESAKYSADGEESEDYSDY